MGLDWLRYGKVRHGRARAKPRGVKTRKGEERLRTATEGKHSDSEEMFSNGTVARGQVKKSNGKVTTRLVWQGKRYDVKSNG